MTYDQKKNFCLVLILFPCQEEKEVDPYWKLFFISMIHQKQIFLVSLDKLFFLVGGVDRSRHLF
jgi:hypothetical protein